MRPTKEELAQIRDLDYEGGVDRADARKLFAEIDAVTAERDEARQHEANADAECAEWEVEANKLRARCERMIEPCATDDCPPRSFIGPDGLVCARCPKCDQIQPMCEWNAAQRAARGES